MKKIIIFIFILADCTIGALFTLNFKCPQYVQRYIQSQVVCPMNPLDYSCLCKTENTTCSKRNEEIAHEYCSKNKPEFAGIGQKYVWSGGLRNIECSSERFQPPGFNLWQNVSSQCLYLKSFCNEKGQVIHINGSAEKDVSCRCDHTMGYAFVTNNNPEKSSCKPLEEDCSCYTKKCLFKETLAKDYSCILSSNDNMLSRNQPVIAATRQSTVEHVALIVNVTEHQYRINFKNGLTGLICLFIIFGSFLMVVFLLGDLNIKCKDNCSEESYSQKLYILLGSFLLIYLFSAIDFLLIVFDKRKELILNPESTRQPSISFVPQLDDRLHQSINCHQLDGDNSENEAIQDELSFDKEMTPKRSCTKADCDVSTVSSCIEKRTESMFTKDTIEKGFSDETISVVVFPTEFDEFVGCNCQFNASISSISSIDVCIRTIEWVHITPAKEITCDLENTKKYKTDDQQSLTILSLESEDAGTYVCRVSNFKETIDSEHIKLNVMELKPNISHRLDRQTIDNEEKTILKFILDVPKMIDITLIFKTNDTENKPTNVAANESFITCDFPICCSGKYELVLKTSFGAVIKRTIDLKIPSAGKVKVREQWTFDELLRNVQKDAKNAVANQAKIDCIHDKDAENQTTTDKQEGSTEQNTNCTQNLDKPHQPTTDENSEATSQNTSCTELLDEPQEPTTDEKSEAISQNTSSTQILDEPHEPTTDDKLESNQLNGPLKTCLNKPSVRAIIALDIGTTHSRYAVLLPETPFVEEKIEFVFKDSVPTAVLFNVTSDNFVACGYKAIKEHKSAVQRDEQKSYLMFEKFKLELYKRMEVTAELEIKDIYERTMLARKVYTAVINDLKQRALIHIMQKNNTIHNDEIVWVMTVPDIWNENAKGFIRLCCELSGITKEQLIVVDDSNAILAYFQKVQYFCRETLPQNVDDKNYLLIDLSGGTCDITGYHTPADFDVGVPIRPSHKLCGVDIVCNVILDRLSSIIGENAMDCLKKEETSSYLQLKEACIQLCLTSDNSLNVPIQTLDNLCTRFREMSFKEAVDGYGKTVSGSDSEQVDIDFTLFRNKLIVRKGLVDNSLKKIIGTAINEIKHILKIQKAQNIQQFFIVGGFSSLSIVQNEIQDAFKDKSVIFANDKVFSSVKGALVYGYEKTRI